MGISIGKWPKSVKWPKIAFPGSKMAPKVSKWGFYLYWKVVLEFWFGHPKCHFGTPQNAQNDTFGAPPCWPWVWLKIIPLNDIFETLKVATGLTNRKLASGFRNDSIAFLTLELFFLCSFLFFSRLDFERESGFFLLGIYFPLTLVVVCSWVGQGMQNLLFKTGSL